MYIYLYIYVCINITHNARMPNVVNAVRKLRKRSQINPTQIFLFINRIMFIRVYLYMQERDKYLL